MGEIIKKSTTFYGFVGPKPISFVLELLKVTW